MGLGLHLQATLGPETLQTFDDPLSEIVTVVSDHAEASGLRVFFLPHRSDGKLGLELHPAAEWVEFALYEGGTLSCMAKTSTVGPGYHRYLVDILDAIALHLGISWQTDEEASGDDTGYLEHREFARLQHEMATLLENLAAIIHEQHTKGLRGLMLNMPVHYTVANIDGIVTPGGIIPAPSFEEALQPGFDISAFAERFFLWWDEGLTAATWRNIGLALLWCEVPWHVPNDEREFTICKNALFCFGRSLALDPHIALPESEIGELTSFLADDADWATEAAATGIGYRRLGWNRDIGGGWVIETPGSFYARVEDDNATEVFWLGEKEIWCTSYALEPAKPVSLVDLDSDLRPDSLIVEKNGFVGCANATLKQDADGVDYITMSCLLKAPGTFATVTIVYPSDASAWAERVFRSIRFEPKPEQAEQVAPHAQT